MCSFLDTQQSANSRPWRTSGGWWATTWACPTPPTSSRTTSKKLGTRSNKCSAGFLFPRFSGRTRCPWSWGRMWPSPWASTTTSWCTRHSCVSLALFMINARPNCGLLIYFWGPRTFCQSKQFKLVIKFEKKLSYFVANSNIKNDEKSFKNLARVTKSRATPAIQCRS